MASQEEVLVCPIWAERESCDHQREEWKHLDVVVVDKFDDEHDSLRRVVLFEEGF
jgi:hypothetical protein